MNANQTFALIDNASGYVWHVCQANSPEAACAKAAIETGGDERAFEHTYQLASNEYGFHVYAAPAGFTVNDGQNAAEIAAVSALPLIGKYREVPY